MAFLWVGLEDMGDRDEDLGSINGNSNFKSPEHSLQLANSMMGAGFKRCLFLLVEVSKCTNLSY